MASDTAARREKQIVVGETAESEPYSLPIEEILTGRAFITGKSGAGKSNSASVIVEELLDRDHPVLIVDTDGEYYGLKEEFELLHVGATEECDLLVGPEHAGKLAELALEQHVPIILDVSGYLDVDEADALVRDVAQELFAREQEALRPFLLLVEEIHEYVPEGGGLDETGEALVRIAKRGRKRGLGIAGLSQRPADVKKDFITQADLLVWHRLTWENDTKVVRRVVGSDYADAVADLEDGEAFVQADWDESDVERVQFKRKRTFDAGATPGLEDVERPELKSIDADLVDELEEISDQHQRRQNRIEDLEARLEERDARIDELEEELEDARDLQRLGEAFIDAAENRGGGEEIDRELLEEKNETIADLRNQVDELEDRLDDVLQERDELAEAVDRLRGIEERVDRAEQIEQQLDRARDVLGVDVEASDQSDEVQRLREELQDARDQIEELEQEREELEKGNSTHATDLASKLQHDAIQKAVTVAKDNSDRADRHFDRVLDVLASSDGGPLSTSEIQPLMDDVSATTVNQTLLSLFEAGIVQREKNGSGYEYSLNEEFLERRIQVAELDSGGDRTDEK